jgi:cardiolipin synthase
MTEAVENATAFAHVQFYILAMDPTTEPFLSALERAVARGVKVRLLLDHLGSRKYPGRDRMTERLTAAGVQWHFTLPVRPFDGQWNRPDLRNHRKLLVVDGRIGFAGSINMIDRTYLLPRNLRRGIAYVDLVVRATGPVVAELDAVFQTDWYSETGTFLDGSTAPETIVLPEATGSTLCQVLPSGPGYDNDNNLKLFTALIHASRRRLVITSPYFVPDESLMTAITSAAQRGVEVTLYSSAVAAQFLVYHAQRSYYEELMAAGVEILLLRGPALLHAKNDSIDDDICVIGSSNLDMRSLTLNLEITLLVSDAEKVRELRQVEADYRERSTPVSAAEWRARSLPRKFADNLARMTAALQ